MPAASRRYFTSLAAAFVCLLLITGCASKPLSTSSTQAQTAALRDQLLQLSGDVDAGEATRVAQTAMERSAALTRQFRAVRPAWFQNWLVNKGWRPGGLCYQWANGLFPSLHALNLRSLELHLAVARMDTAREHNCVVVTARHQPLKDGVVLDAWRHSGHLWFGRVAADKYPWGPLPLDRAQPDLKKLIQKDP